MSDAPLAADAAEAAPGMSGADALKRALLVPLVLVGVALLFASAMVRNVTYDEDQYLAAGWMVAHGLLPYRDFAYLQPPLYPFVLGAVFKLTGGYYLLAARLVTVVLGLVAAGALWALVRRLGAGLALAVVLMAACLGSPFLASTLSNARNDALPLALMLVGLYLFLRCVDRSFWGQVGAAFLLGLAVEAKLTYLFGPVALGLAALWAPRTRLLPVMLGTAVAALPGIGFWLLAPDGFQFGLLSYHLAAPADWYVRQGLPEQLQPAERLSAVMGWAVLGGNLTLLVLGAVLSVIAMARRVPWQWPGLLLLGMLAAASALAAIPSPAWAMYFAPCAPLLACCIAHLDNTTIHSANPMKKRVLFGVAGLATLPVLALMAPEAAPLADRDGWVGLAAHDTAMTVGAAVPPGGTVATLFPHVVMDAVALRPDLSAGPFVFRSGDLFGAGALDRVHALGPPTLEAAFAAERPAAIHTGVFAKAWRSPMDEALAAYARRNNWRQVPLPAGDGVLWLPPLVPQPMAQPLTPLPPPAARSLPLTLPKPQPPPPPQPLPQPLNQIAPPAATPKG